MQRQTARTESKVARAQAEELRLTAQQERAAAHLEAARKRQENAYKLGQQKVGLSGSGFVLDDAQAAHVIGSSVAEATLAEQLIIAQGEQRARNLEEDARITQWSGRARAAGTSMAAGVGLAKDSTSWWDNYGSQFANGTA